MERLRKMDARTRRIVVMSAALLLLAALGVSASFYLARAEKYGVADLSTLTFNGTPVAQSGAEVRFVPKAGDAVVLGGVHIVSRDSLCVIGALPIISHSSGEEIYSYNDSVLGVTARFTFSDTGRLAALNIVPYEGQGKDNAKAD